MRTGSLFVDGGTASPLVLERADRFLERLFGLLGRRSLAADHALWIAPCGSVHTVGMRFPIDVVFVSRDGHVLRIVAAMRPGRFAICRGARSVVELAAGTAGRLALAPGQPLLWSDKPSGTRGALSPDGASWPRRWRERSA